MRYSPCQLITGLESGNRTVLRARAIPEARWLDNQPHAGPFCFEGIGMYDKEKYRLNRESILEKRKEYYSKHRQEAIMRMKRYQQKNAEILKEKRKIYSVEHRKQRREYDRKHYLEQRERIYEKQRKYCEEHREQSRKSVARYQKANPQIVSAQIKAQRNIVLLACCEICGEPATDRHHPNYSKPLEVMHLCGKCHRQIHWERRMAI